MRNTPRFISLGQRLTAATIAVLAVFTWIVYVGLSRYEHDKLIQAKEGAAMAAGELFVRSAATPVIFEDQQGLADTVAMLTQVPDVLGVDLWKSPAPGQIGAPLIARRKAPGEPPVPRWVSTPLTVRDVDRVTLYAPIRDQDGKVIAIAVVQHSLAGENQLYAELRGRILLAAAGAGAVLALLLGIVTRRWITAPLGRLLQAVRQLEAGERPDQTTPRSGDEVGRLTEAFARMADAVDRRERDIVRRNNDMKLIMDNVAQGFLRVTRDGLLLPEHSAVLETWFGPWTEGAPLWEYLRPATPRTADWLSALWCNISLDMLPLEVALGQLPERFESHGRVYSLFTRPIQQGAELTFLVVLSDISVQVEQERQKAGQEELVSLFQWGVKDRAGLLEFFTDAERLVRAITTEQIRDLITLRREVHTLKGNSGIFGLSSMVAVCQAIESRFEEGAEAVPLAERDRLRLSWLQVAEWRRQLIGEEVSGRIEIEAEEHAALLSALAEGVPRGEIVSKVRNWTQEPAKQRLSRMGEQARSLARRLGKGEIVVSIEASGVRLPDKALHPFWASFTHLLRNAVDHGLETPEERVGMGKSPCGHLTLRAVQRGDQLLLEIEDDGRGIDWRKLRARALEAGLPAETRSELVAALFADGITTKEDVSEISGRGVGMSAVRSACERTGGKIRVDSTPHEGTRFQFSWPLSTLFSNSHAPRAPLARGDLDRDLLDSRQVLPEIGGERALPGSKHTRSPGPPS